MFLAFSIAMLLACHMAKHHSVSTDLSTQKGLTNTIMQIESWNSITIAYATEV